MFHSGVTRSSALARAQAQLSGQRIPVGPKDTDEELQEYMNALNKKATLLKNKQVLVQGLSDVSDLSIDDSDSQKKTATKEAGKLQKATVGESRFLKKKKNAEESALAAQGRPAGPNDDKRNPSLSRMGPSMARSSVALRKLAELENKIRRRKLEAEPSDSDSDLKTSDERPFSARSSSELSGRGSRFLKKSNSDKELPVCEVQDQKNVIASQPQQRQAVGKIEVGLESEEEEIKRLIGSSVEFSDENESWRKLRPDNLPTQSFDPKVKRTPSPPTKGSPRRTLHHSASFQNLVSLQRAPSRLRSRTPSPPSRGPPRHSQRARSLSKSPLSSVRSSLTSNSSPRLKLIRQSQTPLSARSDVKSLDELFSRASVIDNVLSDSSDDFKMNILSLDDLAPNTQLDTPKQLEKEQQKSGEKPTAKEQKKAIIPALSDSNKVRHPTKKSVVVARMVAPDTESASEIPTVTDDDLEISEHLTVDSSPRARIRFSGLSHTSSMQRGSTARSAYSDDFEKSTNTGVSKDTDSEKLTLRSSSCSDQSGRYHSSSSLAAELPAQIRSSQPVKQREVKEASIQTDDPAFIYHWSNLSGSAVLGPALGGAYTDPVPIASHVVSSDAVEAMTSYSPAVFALNDMLKQQLTLTQQFMEISRHLHLEMLNSLESECYHYITLEETKEYIRSHKPPSLTKEQTLEDVIQPMREYQP